MSIIPCRTISLVAGARTGGWKTYVLMGFLCLCIYPSPAQVTYNEVTDTEVRALNQAAEQQYKAGRYQEGIASAQRAVEVARQRLGERHPEYATALSNLAKVYRSLSRYSEAGPLFTQALALRKQQLGPEHPDYATALHDLAFFYRVTGRYAEAEKAVVMVLAIRKRKLGDQHTDYATSLNLLAGIYTSTERYAQAEPLYLTALSIREQQLGAEHLSYASTIYDLASLYDDLDRYAEAKPLYLRALAIRKKQLGEQHPNYLFTLSGLAGLYNNMGHYAEAEPLYRTALVLQQQQLGEQHPSYLYSLNSLGSLCVTLGRYKEAETLLLRCIALRKQHQGEGHPSYSGPVTHLGHLYQRMGRYAEAEKLHLDALAIHRQHGALDPDYAGSLNDLGNVYRLMGRHTQAEPLFLEALAIKEKRREQDRDMAVYLNSVAMVYREMSRYTEAESFYLRALAIRKLTLGKQHPEVAYSLDNLGLLYQAMGRYTEAEPLYLEALTLRKQQLGDQHPTYAATLLNLASLHKAAGRFALAESLYVQAIDTRIRHFRETYAGLSEREKQQYLASISSGSEAYHSLLVQLGPNAAAASAYNQLLFTKGLLLASTAGMQRQILASPDTALHHLFGRWQTQKRHLVAAQSLTLAEQQTRGLDPTRLRDQANELEKQLAGHSVAFRQEARLLTTRWQQVQQALRPGEVAVELVRYRWHRRSFTDTICYAAYVLTAKSPSPQLVVLRSGHELESRYLAAYLRLTHAVGGASGATDVVAKADVERITFAAVYNAFWQPIAHLFPSGTTTVYLAADGVYQQLNLNALQNPATGKFLLDELDLHLVGSTRELVREHPSPAAHYVTGIGVLVGNPAYRLSSSPAVVTTASDATRTLPESEYYRNDRFLRGGDVLPLPGTAREVYKVDALFAAAQWARRTYTGAAATEEVVRDVHRPRVLHIATHGFFVSGDRTSSSKPDAEPSEANITAAADPMLRSGLLLAGVNNFRDAPQKPQTEDGILTAYEASLLDLQDTELVVLSACETGLGLVQNGEGVYGLQRGFAVAGARNILMSLWQVDDKVTRELMVNFYRYWLSGKSIRAALLAAQKRVRRHHPEPCYWAAFVLVGD